MKHHMISGLALAFVASFAWGDTLIVGDTTHDHVLVRETEAMYYVQVPATGEIIHVRKDSEPRPELLPASAETRAQLQAQWREQRSQKHAPLTRPTQLSGPQATAAASEAERGDDTPTLRLRGDFSRQQAQATDADGRVSGQVPSIRMQDVTLAQALDAILRPMGLDYEVRGNVVFISKPETLRRETWQRVETRIFQVANDYGTLPKIVLRNPFAQVGGFGGGFGQQGGGQFGGGLGGGGFGQQGGMGGGFGQQGGFGGGFGQFGGGFGGGFGQQGGGFGGADVTQITNISDLFSTIDDRIVGESPAIIGGMGLRSLRNNGR